MLPTSGAAFARAAGRGAWPSGSISAVWTLGAEGVRDEQEKLVTIDVNPKSPNYGKVVHTLSVGGRNEAHHSGFTDDRHDLWASGLDTSKIFSFDVHSDPSKPSLHKTIDY